MGRQGSIEGSDYQADDETAASVSMAADIVGYHPYANDVRFHGFRDGQDRSKSTLMAAP